jgi:hypothetical protein
MRGRVTVSEIPLIQNILWREEIEKSETLKTVNEQFHSVFHVEVFGLHGLCNVCLTTESCE